jgi:hypothetical protein
MPSDAVGPFIVSVGWCMMVRTPEKDVDSHA